MRIAFAYSFHDRDWLGGRNYFASLFGAVESLQLSGVQLVLVTGTRTQTSLPEQFPWLEVIRTPLLDKMQMSWLARQVTLRAFGSDPLLARFLRQQRIDLLSHSGYLGSDPQLATLAWLFDFQFLHLPQHWTPRQLRWVRRRYASACQQCDGVVVSSHDALQDLNSFLPEGRAQRHVLRFVSNPVDFSCIASKTEITAKYGLSDDYLYLPNQFWSHKNHAVVIDALQLLQRHGFTATVACTGNTADLRDPNFFPELIERSRNAGIGEMFRVLGMVPFADTQALMLHARAVINPSKFEGWSTTVEEAKTLQRPLLLTDLRVHREQSPDNARFFSPDDAPALARHIQDILELPAHETDQRRAQEIYLQRQRAFAETYARIVHETYAAHAARR